MSASFEKTVQVEGRSIARESLGKAPLPATPTLGYAACDSFSRTGQMAGTVIKHGGSKVVSTTVREVAKESGRREAARLVAREGLGKSAIQMTVIATIAVVALECGYELYRWFSGDITTKRLIKNLISVVGSGVSGAVVGMGGAAVGGAVGSFLCPGVGTIIGMQLTQI